MKCCLCKKKLKVANPTTNETNITICHVICLEKARQKRLLNMEFFFFNELTNF